MGKGARGNVLMQAMVAAAAVGGLALMVSRISKQSTLVGARIRDSSTITSLRSRGASMSQDPGAWVNQMRKITPQSSNVIYNCLSLTTIFSCPAAQAPAPNPGYDPEVLVQAQAAVPYSLAGYTISTIALYDTNQIQIAAANTTNNQGGMYFDQYGSPCAGGYSSPTCKFRAIGYLIRQNPGLTVDPGNVILVRKVESAPLYVYGSLAGVTAKVGVEQARLKPTYDVYPLGTTWRNPAGNGVPVGTLVAYPGLVSTVTSIPGFRLSDGATLSRTTYPQLYAAIGCAWGCPSGITFRIPNMTNGAILTGSSSTIAVGSAIASSAGNHVHTVSQAQFQGGTLTGNINFAFTPTTAMPSVYLGDPHNLTGGGQSNAPSSQMWGIPAMYADFSGTGTGTATIPAFSFTPPTALSAAGQSYLATQGAAAAFAANLDAETLPKHVPVNYLIRLDYN